MSDIVEVLSILIRTALSDDKQRIPAWRLVEIRDEIERLRTELAEAKAATETAVKAEREMCAEAIQSKEAVAEIFEAMRFEREDATPPFKNGNSHAEARARVAAINIAAAIRGGDTP